MGRWQPKGNTLPFLLTFSRLGSCVHLSCLSHPNAHFLYAFCISLNEPRNNLWIFHREIGCFNKWSLTSRDEYKESLSESSFSGVEKRDSVKNLVWRRLKYCSPTAGMCFFTCIHPAFSNSSHTESRVVESWNISFFLKFFSVDSDCRGLGVSHQHCIPHNRHSFIGL